MRNVLRFLLQYFAVAVAGTAAFLLIIPCLRIWIVETALKRAEGSLAAGHHPEALETLDGVTSWVSMHPILSQRHAVLRIKCHIRLGKMKEAESVAEALFNNKYPQAEQSSVFWEKFLVFQEPIANFVFGRKQDSPESDCGIGYRVMIDELFRSGQRDEPTALASRLADRHPRDLRALKIRADVAALAPEMKHASPSAGVQHAPRTEGEHREPTGPVAAPVTRQPTGDTCIENSSTPRLEAGENRVATESQSLATEAVGRWAVVRGTNVKAYDSTGRFLCYLSPGTIVEVSGFRNSNVGQVALCTTNPAVPATTPVIVRSNDLDVGVNGTGPASQKEKELKVLRAKLEAELSHHVEIDSRNPHAREYETAKRAYDDFWKKVRELQAKRDSATGEKRMRYSDELYRLKGRAVVIGQQYETAKKKYEAWQKEGTTRERAENAEVVLLRSRLAEIEKEIARLGGDN